MPVSVALSLGDLLHPDMGDWNGSDKAEADKDQEGEQVESHPSSQNSGNGTLNKYDELLLAALQLFEGKYGVTQAN